MKVITVCQGGNVRSVAAGFILKYMYNIDAIAVSWEKNSKETLHMLYSWAEKIVIMQKEFDEFIPEEFKDKILVVDVGPDRWGNSLHPELISEVGIKLQQYIVDVTKEEGL